MKTSKFGHLVFGLGALLVIIFTAINPASSLQPLHAIILLLGGLLVGLIDVSKKETVPFLLAFIGFLITSNAPLHVITYYDIGIYLKSFLMNMSIFLTLAVVAVSTKVLYRVYKGR